MQMSIITFDQILAQTIALDALRRAFLADRLPHGLLFAGPVGVGKGTTAAALAALFLCRQPEADRPCGRCDSCQVFPTGNHPDYHIITKELIRYHDKTGRSKGIDLSINVLRPELIEPAGRKAVMGNGKVFVIEQAEMMNPQAQNGLLKTLEEPAGRTLIVLLTDQPNSLLATVRSRCQAIRFAALPEELVKQELIKRGIAANLAAPAAALSEGSLGESLRWIEDGIIVLAKELIAQLQQVAGGGGAADLQDWFKKVAESYAEKQLARDELASKDQATRQGYALYLRLASLDFRRRLMATDDAEAMERICSAIDAVAQAEAYLDANVNIALVFQQLGIALERTLAVR
jgi:DNA polymerase III subunit delta'